MSKSEEVEKSQDLREKALDTQRSVGVVTELVDAVHRHTLAAKTSQVALTTEVNELKNKHKKFTKCAKALVKKQKKGKTGTLGEIAKEITGNLFHKNDQEQRGKEGEVKNQPSAPVADENNEPPPSYDMRVEANVTDAELAKGKEEWAVSVMQARKEATRLRQVQTAVLGKAGGPSVVGMRMLDEREKNLDELQDAAIAAKIRYDRLKEEYAKEREAERKGFSIATTPGQYEPVEKRLRIQDMKRVMIPLVPGQKIPWATLMEQVVNRGIPGEEALALQALIPQLAGHNEVVAQATNILVQAAGKPYHERQLLRTFFEWMQSKYQLSPQQKRAIFARKLREMKWNWRTNPADKITSILTEVQLTWEEVVNQPALREELETALASKLNITLQLKITQRSPEQWKQAITEIWENVKHNNSLGLH